VEKELESHVQKLTLEGQNKPIYKVLFVHFFGSKSMKETILKNICYTDLVYDRINKKLSARLERSEIEKLIFTTLSQTEDQYFVKIGKNYYVSNPENKITITINSHTFRVITVSTTRKTKGDTPIQSKPKY
jgi:biotin synthase-related radical SAM superfamily protein